MGMDNLALHQRCSTCIQQQWSGFQQKRRERLALQGRFGEAAEKVAENILEDLFTTVLDWPLSDVNNQVGYTKVSGIPEQAIPDVLVRLARAATSLGRMPHQQGNSAPIYRQLAEVLEQLDRLDEIVRSDR